MEKLQNICRLCLDSNGSSNISVTDSDLQAKMQVIFKFEFIEEERFPNRVCLTCSSKIMDYHHFHEMVCANQAQLLALSNTVMRTSSPDDIKLDISLDFVEKYSDKSYKSDSPAIDTDTTVLHSISPSLNPGIQTNDELLKVMKRTRRKKIIPLQALNKISAEEKVRRLKEENRKIKEFFTLNCEICTESFDSFDKLQRHTRKIHKTQGTIKCCNRIFYKKCRILDHINSHVNPNQYHCNICNKNYNDKYYLDLHRLRMHNTGKKPFKCDKCAQTFHKEYLLKAHLSTHIQVQCSICHKILASASTLRTHMIHMHSEDSKLICDSCGQAFRTKLAMERHIKRHLGINPIERIQCDICSKWVNGRPNLKVHIKTVHSEEKQEVACDLCQQIYPNIRALGSHKRRVHVEERFECEFCGKKFKRNIYLKEHRASHTGQTLYSCDVCGMCTNSNANLYSHKKSKHPEEWMAAKKKAIAVAYGQ
ncbi:zinc finger protein 62 homolog [Malaya genurostris]|uniref:zinc finger protein 62 homolog n=1 Tax=Malaya genurostris TaxID=325434 RepID=UPI0026F3EDE3|nr:zinc finger protein 62 homolog [Malaya genurostris]